MAFKVLDRVAMTVTGAPGTGNVTVGSALQSYQTLAAAGLSDGDTFSYLLKDGANWEYGKGTWTASGGSFTRTVTKSNASPSTNPINASSKTIVSAVLLAEDFSNTQTLQGLSDVNVTEGSGIDGWSLTFSNSTGKWIAANVSGGGGSSGTVTTVKNNGTNVDTAAVSLNFVNATSITTSGHVVTITLPTGGGGGSSTLSGLSDVQISSVIGGQALIYNAGASKWENTGIATVATTGAYSDLSGKPSLATVATTGAYSDLSGLPTLHSTLVGLTDVNITTGSGVNGYSVTWNNSTSKFVLTNVSGGGGSGVTIENNGTSVGTSQTTLNFVNATSITSSSSTATITLPTGGGGGGGGPGGTMTPPTAAALAAETNIGSMTLTTRSTGVLIPCLHVKPTGASDGNIYCIEQAAPSGDWSCVVKVRPMVVSDDGDGYHGAGIVFRDSTHGYLMCFCITPTNKLYYCFATGGTGTFTTGAPSSAETIPDTDFFLHLDWNNTATTFTMGISRNGIDKINYYSFSAGYMSANPTYVGICWLGDYSSSNGGGQSGPEYDFQHYFCGTAGSNGL